MVEMKGGERLFQTKRSLLFFLVESLQNLIRLFIQHEYHLNGDCTRINHSNQRKEESYACKVDC